MNTLFLILSLLFTTSLHAQSGDPMTFVAKVYFSKPMMLVPTGSHEAIVAILSHPELAKKVEEFEPGDEAIVKGRLIHQPRTVEDRVTYQSVILIDDIRPISLKRLGSGVTQPLPERSFSPITLNQIEPRSWPVSTEVATTLTLTLTATTLLLNGLIMNSQPQVVESLNAGMIIFAGTLAWGSFVFDTKN